jgi:hypothetical protein
VFPNGTFENDPMTAGDMYMAIDSGGLAFGFRVRDAQFPSFRASKISTIYTGRLYTIGLSTVMGTRLLNGTMVWDFDWNLSSEQIGSNMSAGLEFVGRMTSFSALINELTPSYTWRDCLGETLTVLNATVTIVALMFPVEPKALHRRVFALRAFCCGSSKDDGKHNAQNVQEPLVMYSSFNATDQPETDAIAV